jgi:uncharacterized protein (DUF362 family)
MMKPLVSISRCTDIHSFESVNEAVRESVELAGGLESFLIRGDLVLIKPNILFSMDYKTGAVTNPHVVRALIRMAREAGAGKVVIGESSIIGCKTRDAFAKSGYDRLAEEEEVDLIDLKKTETVYTGIPNGKIFRRLEIPEIVLRADIIINVPAMKTHDMFPVTLGLKNMKGVIQDQDKKRFHVVGVEQSVVDINKLVLPQLTVIDGTVGMEGIGPMHGEPVNLGLVVTSMDTVAADAVGASIMGVDPKEVTHIRLAAEQGLGCDDLTNIDVVGKAIEEVVRPFKIAKIDLKEFEKKLGIQVIESGACSGCRQVVDSLFTYYMKNNLDVFKDRTIVFGQNVKLPSRTRGKPILFGPCTKKYRDKGDYMPGCPPMQENVMQYFGVELESEVTATIYEGLQSEDSD